MFVRFGGAQEFRRAAGRLDAIAHGEVAEASRRAFSDEAPALVRAAKDGAQRLPQEGGLADRVAGTHIFVDVGGGAASARLALIADNNAVKDPGAINRGRVRKPVFGRWTSSPVIQLVPPGWFSEPLTKKSGDVRAALDREVSAVIRRGG